MRAYKWMNIVENHQSNECSLHALLLNSRSNICMHAFAWFAQKDFAWESKCLLICWLAVGRCEDEDGCFSQQGRLNDFEKEND